MNIYLVGLIIHIPHAILVLDISAAILLLTSAIINRRQARLWRLGLFLWGLTGILDAFNRLYAQWMNSRVPFVMNAIHVALVIVAAIVMVIAYNKKRQTSGR